MTAKRHCVAIIQARMSSTRLAGKVLLEIAGQPMLVRVVERTRRARQVNDLVVATTQDAADDPIEELCRLRGYTCHRGSMQDVLDRYYHAARLSKAEVVVRITADCPLIDPDLIDLTIREFLGSGADFAANRLPPPWKRTYPIGLDVEVCSFSALEQAWREARKPYQREHVMPFLYEGTVFENDARNPGVALSPRGFKIVYLNHEPDYGVLRWTVDTPEDLALVREIYAHFEGCDNFSWQEVLALFASRPDLARINAGVPHKTFRDVDGQSKTEKHRKD